MLLYTFLVIFFFSFARYKEYITCLISFSNFSNVLPAFTCARAIDYLSRICLGVNTFSLFALFSFIGNIPLLKVLRANSWPS